MGWGIPRPIGTVLAENLSMRNRERSLQLPIPDVQVDSWEEQEYGSRKT